MMLHEVSGTPVPQLSLEFWRRIAEIVYSGGNGERGELLYESHPNMTEMEA